MSEDTQLLSSGYTSEEYLLMMLPSLLPEMQNAIEDILNKLEKANVEITKLKKIISIDTG